MHNRGRQSHTEQRGAEMGRCSCVAGVNPSQPSFTELPASHSSTSYYLASTQSFCFSLTPPLLLPVRCQHWRQTDKVCGILPRERGYRLCISVSLSLTFSPYLPLLAFFPNPLRFVDRGCCRWSKTPRGAEQAGLFSDDSDDGRHEWRLP